jgi:hypothetical protein
MNIRAALILTYKIASQSCRHLPYKGSSFLNRVGWRVECRAGTDGRVEVKEVVFFCLTPPTYS